MSDLFIIIIHSLSIPSLERNGLFPLSLIVLYPFPQQAVEEDLVIQGVFDKRISQKLNKK